jgi:hypothetical protein
MSPRLAYVAAVVFSIAVFVAALVLANAATDARSPWILVPLICAMAFFPRKWLARRLSSH